MISTSFSKNNLATKLRPRNGLSGNNFICNLQSPDTIGSNKKPDPLAGGKRPNHKNEDCFKPIYDKPKITSLQILKINYL